MTTSDKSQDELQRKDYWYPTIAKIGKKYEQSFIDHDRDGTIYAVQDLMNEVGRLIAANNARVTTEILELLITEGYQHHERDIKLQNTMESMLQDINASRPTATGTEGNKQ